MNGAENKKQRLATVEEVLRDYNINPMDLIARDEIVRIKYQNHEYEFSYLIIYLLNKDLLCIYFKLD